MTVSIKPALASLILAAACTAHAADAPPSALAVDPGDAAVTGPPSAQMAVRDATTGRLRAATPSEAASLHAAGPQVLRTTRATPNLTRYHASGAIGARLSDSALSYAMVVRQPDGRMTEYCFPNREAAEAALAAPVAAPVNNTLPTE